MSDQTAITQIFEYLLAVKNLDEKIPREITAYQKVWWQQDLPNSVHGTEPWLNVHKQKIPTAPNPPKQLSNGVEDWQDPNKKPKKSTTKMTADQEEIYKDWLKNKWVPWSKEALEKQAIQTIYDQLFTIYQQLQREGDELEICWGHGLLNWQIESESIKRHLFVTKMELQFDPRRGLFTLVPTSSGMQLETDMLANLSIPNWKQIIELESQIVAADLDPRNEDALEPVYHEIIETLNVDEQSSQPSISYSPAIFLRKNGTRLWINELTTAIEKIKTGYPVPEIIKEIATVDHQPELVTGDDNEWADVGGNLLFPLETNNEQRLIAQKLATNAGVLVHGPPGTGKSHTIANLISHLLAHGKRVLVTSEKERALEVIRDKIPEQIRALCVSILGGDARSVEEIEASIKYIAESLDNKQPEILDKNMKHVTKEMETTKRKIAHWDSIIKDIAAAENAIINLDGHVYTPLEASKWLTDNRAHNWLPDRVTVAEAFPLTNQEQKRFFQLLGEISEQDQQSYLMYRPATATLIDPPAFARAVEDFALIEQEVIKRETDVADWELNERTYSFSIEEKRELTSEALEQLTYLQKEPWRTIVLKEISADPTRLATWTDFYQEVRERVETIESITNDLLEDEIRIDNQQNSKLVKEDLQSIEDRLDEDKSIGWLFQNIFGRKYQYIFDTCTINGLPIRTKEDVTKLRKYVDYGLLIEKLVLKWNRTMDEYQGPTITADQKRLPVTMKLLLDDINNIITRDRDVIKQLEEIGTEIDLQIDPGWDSQEWLTQLKNALTAIEYQKKRQEAKHIFLETVEQLNQASLQPNAHPLIDLLVKACQERDASNWKSAWNELRRLENLSAHFTAYQQIKRKLQAVAPIWTDQLEKRGGQGKVMTAPADLKLAWKWQQLSGWIKEIHDRPKLEEIEENLQLEKKKEIRLIKELVATSTWKAQIKRTTTEQKRSLYAWLKAIQRIGKGTSKYANTYRKEASKEMAIARGAIPVWIMPIKSVIEHLSLTAEQFDVVIVDESSQSNLFSLSALLRGKKVVIVGDDNQISPESVGTDIGDVHELIERYLEGIPNKLQFDMKTSLYDTASRVFDSKIILKEHFRSVPEIIQFSNAFMYRGEIDPLRLPLGKGALDPPVSAVYVKAGHRDKNTKKAINRPEAEAIVEQIAKMCADQRYVGKSMGVISLQGHDQAKIIENRLREVIGEEEVIKRKLICGDAYSFQGDERDVILLSLVASPNVRTAAMTARSAYQRFNVAASRARDQMILYYSVDLAELNPEDVRYKLLKYCIEPFRAQHNRVDALDNFDSKFEEDVCQLIRERGYRVVPQVHVGTVGKKIDLVVEGMRNRLAIECDGDYWHGLEKWEDDMDRQRVLERVGWTFWRIRGSDFYLNRKKSLETLWIKLAEMGIEKEKS